MVSELRDEGEAYVVLSLEGQEALHKAEVTVMVGGLTARAELKSQDMYASIDGVLEKLERQIHRYKTKFEKALRHRGGLRQTRNGLEAEETMDSETEEPFRIARVNYPHLTFHV